MVVLVEAILVVRRRRISSASFLALKRTSKNIKLFPISYTAQLQSSSAVASHAEEDQGEDVTARVTNGMVLALGGGAVSPETRPTTTTHHASSHTARRMGWTLLVGWDGKAVVGLNSFGVQRWAGLVGRNQLVERLTKTIKMLSTAGRSSAE